MTLGRGSLPPARLPRALQRPGDLAELAGQPAQATRAVNREHVGQGVLGALQHPGERGGATPQLRPGTVESIGSRNARRALAPLRPRLANPPRRGPFRRRGAR